MYKIDKLNELAKVVAAKRAENTPLEPRRMTAEEKDDLLAHFHPDYKQDLKESGILCLITVPLFPCIS